MRGGNRQREGTHTVSLLIPTVPFQVVMNYWIPSTESLPLPPKTELGGKSTNRYEESSRHSLELWVLLCFVLSQSPPDPKSVSFPFSSVIPLTYFKSYHSVFKNCLCEGFSDPKLFVEIVRGVMKREEFRGQINLENVVLSNMNQASRWPGILRQYLLCI